MGSLEGVVLFAWSLLFFLRGLYPPNLQYRNEVCDFLAHWKQIFVNSNHFLHGGGKHLRTNRSNHHIEQRLLQKLKQKHPNPGKYCFNDIFSVGFPIYIYIYVLKHHLPRWNFLNRQVGRLIGLLSWTSGMGSLAPLLRGSWPPGMHPRMVATLGCPRKLGSMVSKWVITYL